MPSTNTNLQAKRLHAKARQHFAGRLPELRSGTLRFKPGAPRSMTHDCFWFRSKYPWIDIAAKPEDVADYHCLVFCWNPLVQHSAALVIPVFPSLRVQSQWCAFRSSSMASQMCQSSQSAQTVEHRMALRELACQTPSGQFTARMPFLADVFADILIMLGTCATQKFGMLHSDCDCCAEDYSGLHRQS